MSDFKDIIGQEQLKHTLLTAIASGNPSHAYIFNGAVGSGRDMLADAFAKTLLCTGNKEKKLELEKLIRTHQITDMMLDELDACDICRSCRQAASGNNPDIIYITHEKASISVDDIREQLVNTISIKPYNDFCKVYIVPDANKMTEAAQNALLKTIEEPPEYAVIILISENASLFLPTVRSRCVELNMRPVGKGEITDYLINTLQMDPSSADTAANFCQGNLGTALRFATSTHFTEMKNDVLALLKNIDSMPLYDIIDVIRKFATNRPDIDDYLDLMMLWYRDVLMFKVTKDTNILLYSDEYSAISEQASRRSYENIQSIIDGINKAKLRLKSNVNFDITIELMVLNIKDSSK